MIAEGAQIAMERLTGLGIPRTRQEGSLEKLCSKHN
jgi:hypothetical protein